MTADDLLDILDKVPAEDMGKVVLCLRSGAAITIDTIARKETDYLVLRGRENGTTDEGRAFFVPYEDVLFVKLDRPTRVDELKRMYGEKVAVAAGPTDERADGTATTPAPSAPMDPAAIAKQNLLDRIRAARANATGATGKLSGR